MPIYLQNYTEMKIFYDLQYLTYLFLLIISYLILIDYKKIELG